MLMINFSVLFARMNTGWRRLLAKLEYLPVIQRILAFGVTSLWAFVGINVVAAVWVEAIYPAIEVKESMMAFAMSDYVFWPVLAVLGLYFTGGVIPKRSSKE